MLVVFGNPFGYAYGIYLILRALAENNNKSYACLPFEINF